MNTAKHGLDRELIIVFGVIAFCAAIGILFLGVFFLDIDVRTCDKALLLAVYSTLSIVIWGFLLCRNC